MSLEDLRRKIDATDTEILELLNRRARLALDVGEQKRQTNAPMYAPARETQVFERLAKANGGPLPAPAIRAIYREIISASLALEQPLKVAYWGPPGSHSDTAARQQFGGSAERLPVGSIAEVFDHVEKGIAHYGVVPAENSTEGVVPYTLDLFTGCDARICSELFLNITHHLLSRCKSLAEVRRVHVSPQPLAQCRQWLSAHLPGVTFVDVSTTSQAAQACLSDLEGAAVAGQSAADLYDLPILCPRIEDNPRNRTRFWVIGFTEPDRSTRNKTSLLISVEHRPGGLVSALGIFDRHGINLTAIQSRPTKQEPWEYLFFVDAEGYVTDPPMAEAVAALNRECHFVRVLGSYPAAD